MQVNPLLDFRCRYISKTFVGAFRMPAIVLEVSYLRNEDASISFVKALPGFRIEGESSFFFKSNVSKASRSLSALEPDMLRKCTLKLYDFYSGKGKEYNHVNVCLSLYSTSNQYLSPSTTSSSLSRSVSTLSRVESIDGDERNFRVVCQISKWPIGLQDEIFYCALCVDQYCKHLVHR